MCKSIKISRSVSSTIVILWLWERDGKLKILFCTLSLKFLTSSFM
jgi:hypothetical protein